jgi:hypothetical protein
VAREGWVVSALIVVQIVLLAMTIGAFAFMLSSLWATLKVTFVGVPESAPQENEAEESPDDVVNKGERKGGGCLEPRPLVRFHRECNQHLSPASVRASSRYGWPG